MTAGRTRSFAIFMTGTLVGAIFSTAIVFAWTGPTGAPPNGNVSAPINIGSTDQVKNAGLSVNALAVFGNSILSRTTNYLNFGTVSGATGYGIRNNSGTLESKNSGGNWAVIGAGNVIGGGSCHPNYSNTYRCPDRYNAWGTGQTNGACSSGTQRATGLGSGNEGGGGYPTGFIFVTGFICVR